MTSLAGSPSRAAPGRETVPVGGLGVVVLAAYLGAEASGWPTAGTIAWQRCLILGGGGGVAAVALARRAHRESVGQRRRWVLFAAAVAALTAGNAVAFGHSSAVGRSPSPADALVLAAAALAVAGFLSSRSRGTSPVGGIRAALDGLLLATSLLLLAWVAGLGDVFEATRLDPAAAALRLAYPVLELCLVALAVHHLRLQTPAGDRSLRLLTAAVAVFAGTDAAWNVDDLRGLPAHRPLLAAGYGAAFLLMTVAAVAPRRGSSAARAARCRGHRRCCPTGSR